MVDQRVEGFLLAQQLFLEDRGQDDGAGAECLELAEVVEIAGERAGEATIGLGSVRPR